MVSARDIKALGLIGLECTSNHETVMLIILSNTHSIITSCVYNTFVILFSPGTSDVLIAT